jgi:hypothetical protein
VAQALEPVAEGPGPDRGPVAGTPRQTGELEPLAVTAERVGGETLPKERAVYPGRFMLGYLLIVLFFGALLIGFTVAWSRHTDDGDDTATTWSFFKPTADSEPLRVRQIARFVGDRYQTNDGQQLARVLGGPPAVQDAPVTQFQIRDAGKQESIGAGKAIMYILCGAGSDCALPLEASSTAHERLLRREALELALYTFKYVDGIESVTIFLPPPPGPEGQASAVFLRKGDVQSQLSKPLSRTLAPGAPAIGQIPAKELQAVNGITGARLYTFQYTQAQDLSAVLVLDPIVA